MKVFLGTLSFKRYTHQFELVLIAVEIFALFRAFRTACLSQVRPEVRAYIHKELCVMFTTMPYTLDPKFLGGSKEGTFEPVFFFVCAYFVYTSVICDSLCDYKGIAVYVLMSLLL